MTTRPTSPASLWRYAPVVLLLCLCAAPAFAQAPIHRVPAANTSTAEYQRDVADVADNTVNPKQFSKLEIAHLKYKWRAAGKGDQFERDCAAAAARTKQFNQQQQAEQARDINELRTGIGGVLQPTGSTWIFFAVI